MIRRASARERGYGTAWEKARRGFLQAHPWCVRCESEGRRTHAQHVHHAVPHKGDQAIFWDRSRWVPLCQACHNGPAQEQDNRGFSSAIGADGLPRDRAHPFLAHDGGHLESRGSIGGRTARVASAALTFIRGGR